MIRSSLLLGFTTKNQSNQNKGQLRICAIEQTVAALESGGCTNWRTYNRLAEMRASESN
jgi:hypothetical protein